MDLFTSKQQKIDRRAAEVMAAYPALWSQMITEWHQPGSEDRAWLMYSTNYLFRTANVRWTIDPLRLKRRLPNASEMSAGELKDLVFILLTHQHGDHLDLSLLHQLIDFPILWVIPAPVL
jgi:glyoxylase-like metal-dependent hydrolase (beta-lactamase superfamily II)